MEDIKWTHRPEVERMDEEWGAPFTHSHQSYYSSLSDGDQLYLDEDGRGQWYFSCYVNGVYTQEFIPVSGTPEEMQAVAMMLWRMR